MTPAVSIVVPAFRSARHLRTAIPRLLEQEHTDFEIVIVDDGSGDDTGSTAEALAADDSRVRALLLPHNVGVAHARREGVRASRAEYIWFVDSDDDWPDDALMILLGAARSSDADVVIAQAEFVYRGGSRRTLAIPAVIPDADSGFRMLLRGEITGHLWNKLFRRSIIDAVSFTPARVQSDMIMVAEALARSARVSLAPQVVYRYQLRDDSIITSVSQRASSLRLIDAVVTDTAKHLGLGGHPDLRYFRARYVQLSGIKDALLAAYSPSERRALLRDRRQQLRWSDVALFARRRDARRFALAVTAKTSVRAHQALLKIADR